MYKACDRCGSSDNDEYDTIEPCMCAEVQIAFGLIAWLCHSCRKEFHRFIKDHPISKEYGEATLKFEFWKARVGPDSDPSFVNEGLALWKSIDELELKMNETANRWLISDLDELRTN